ncbi:methyl-accepting chemotaxis protein [Campylobacter lari]|uniref:PAS sensor-containing signal-transduction protein n=1 Tax=Campylobacter lari NCTC 11845 TaxID=1388749 RepID=A0A0A8HXQ6_CAMLA|nr:PAS domain-containing protein [Campylobacter lari]AJD01565.1 PAS sensor-containing signal-transduction protein [Campylobacter lari NCTC 11845]EAK0848094.1 PAS domain-containing protein [Campylobacter lari]EAK9953857.1 PAS domain-containing protein [Campylobacter lari]MCR6543234.1 PAS domain-containing protein [Campylobacter lari]STA73927.1 methyl-accepting chemotaxis protein [Campylobacter lari]
MRKIQPTLNEKFFNDGQIIISKTDKTGRIVYCNRNFMILSGYKESELLGKPHNIIRHPDMPKVVFEILWESIKNKKEVIAYVKNLSKDGSFYWVLAFITPSFDSNGEVMGYHSMRLNPKREAIEKIERLYKELLLEEQKCGKKASRKMFEEILNAKGMSYEEMVLSI